MRAGLRGVLTLVQHTLALVDLLQEVIIPVSHPPVGIAQDGGKCTEWKRM